MTYQPWSFGGITFYVESQGGFTPMPIAEDQFAVAHIPGSDINYVDYAGTGPLTLRVTVVMAWAQKAALFALRGTRAALLVPEASGQTTYSSSLLASLGNLQTDHQRQFVRFEAVWLLGSA